MILPESLWNWYKPLRSPPLPAQDPAVIALSSRNGFRPPKASALPALWRKAARNSACTSTRLRFTGGVTLRPSPASTRNWCPPDFCTGMGQAIPRTTAGPGSRSRSAPAERSGTSDNSATPSGAPSPPREHCFALPRMSYVENMILFVSPSPFSSCLQATRFSDWPIHFLIRNPGGQGVASGQETQAPAP